MIRAAWSPRVPDFKRLNDPERRLAAAP